MSVKKINEVRGEEGPLFEISVEDGLALVFHTRIVATTNDGRVWRHNVFLIPGFKADSEGFNYPNMSYKEEVAAITDRISRRGEIDTQYWTLVEEGPSLEERFAVYAYEENLERQGIRA